jgi:hypothetical protein
MILARDGKFVRRILLSVAVMAIGGLTAVAQSAATPAPLTEPAAHPSESTSPASGRKESPSRPVTVLEDTLIRVRTSEPVNSKRAKEGSPVLFIVSEDVYVGDLLAMPRGATVRGVVIKSKKACVLTGSPELALQLTSLELGGRSYPLDSYQFKVKGTSKTQPTETKALRGAEVGAVVGSIIGGVSTKGGTTEVHAGNPVSMAADAAVGAGVGTAISAVTPGPGIWIPSEAEVDFYLAVPVTVTPVSAKEAARLAEGLHSGGPALYLRGEAP